MPLPGRRHAHTEDAVAGLRVPLLPIVAHQQIGPFLFVCGIAFANVLAGSDRLQLQRRPGRACRHACGNENRFIRFRLNGLVVNVVQHRGFLRLNLRLNQPDVDVAAATGVPASYCQDGRPRTKRLPGLLGNGELQIVRRAPGHLGRQHAIQVDVGVVIGVNLKLKVSERAVGQDDLAAQPDFAGVPRRTIHAVWGALVAEAARSSLPRQVVEVRLEPVIGRPGESVAPILFLVFGGRNDHRDLDTILGRTVGW